MHDPAPPFLHRLDWPHAAPAAVVAVVVSLYWWRVIRMAYKMRRKTGRAANFVPTEPLGRVLRIVWQPVVGLWIALPWWMAIGGRGPWLVQPLPVAATAAWVAAAVAVAALMATMVCWKKMGKSWRMGIDPGETTDLVFSGPFAYVRHPIYTLSSVLMIATAVIAPSPLMIGVAIIHLLLLQWEARREEHHLCRVHGEPYRQYLRQVGRFLPRSLHPLKSEASAA